MSDARRAAFEFLLHGERRRRHEAASRLDPAHRATFTELVAGVARRALTLDHIARAYFTRPVKRLDPAVEVALRLGLYQMLVTEAPVYAAVGETVGLIPKPRARGFVNAVLRAVSRSFRPVEDTAPSTRHWRVEAGRTVAFDRDVFPDPAEDRTAWRAAHHGFAKEAIALLAEGRADDDVERVLEVANSRPVTTIRVTGEGSVDDVVASLRADGYVLDPAGDRLFSVVEGGDPVAHPTFEDGAITVQGAFAASVARLAGVTAGTRVLDVCAPPGSKACQLAEAGAHVTALTVNGRDGDRIAENARRLGVADRIVVASYDGRPENLPEGPWDVVLLDVPCTNTGVLARRPEARRRLDRAAIRDLTRLQAKLVHGALRRLEDRPGPSRLLYATCSILDAEGAALLAAVLADHPRATLGESRSALPLSRAEDGGYAARVDVAAAR